MKTRTKATAIILTAVIVLSAFSVCGTAYAAEIPIPKQYDSRDYGYITPVRNQLAYGTCWAHGTMPPARRGV